LRDTISSRIYDNRYEVSQDGYMNVKSILTRMPI
jgi:hypothetical protein